MKESVTRALVPGAGAGGGSRGWRAVGPIAAITVGLVMGARSQAWAHANNSTLTINSMTTAPCVEPGQTLHIAWNLTYTAGSNHPSAQPTNIKIDLESAVNDGLASTASALTTGWLGSYSATGSFDLAVPANAQLGNWLVLKVMTQSNVHGGSPTAWPANVTFEVKEHCGVDPFPDGTTSYSQGFYGASPGGEAVVDDMLDAAACEAIKKTLDSIGELAADYDCDSDSGRADLAYFLTGLIGPGKDGGFLPSGFAPGQTLAAQEITLHLNLGLAAILAEGFQPLYPEYFLNIHAVEDLFGDPPAPSVPPTMVDPVLYIPELVDGTAIDTNGDGVADCTDRTGDGNCTGVSDSATSVDLSSLGLRVLELDNASVTVADMLQAASELLDSGAETTAIKGVPISRGEVTKILGLINESYHEAVPTGLVTAYDAD